jgi:hypothetical protein
MKRYANLSGDSGVVAYALGSDSIRVRFRDGWTYEYTSASAGRAHVEAMKALAVAGRGLSTYITRHVRTAYASRSED